MKLIVPTSKHENAYKIMIADYVHKDSQIDKHFLEASFDYDDYIKSVKKKMDEKTQYQWLLIDEHDVIGTVRLRLALEDGEAKDEHGHIGYDISPSYRGLGYGKLILKLVLEEARKQGMSKVLITCAVDNGASQKIIEHHHGKLIDIMMGEEGLVRRYWILI